MRNVSYGGEFMGEEEKLRVDDAKRSAGLSIRRRYLSLSLFVVQRPLINIKVDKDVLPL